MKWPSSFFFFLFFVLGQDVYAESLTFLKVNHPERNHEIHYSIQHDNCRLRPLAPINIQVIHKKDQKVRELHLLEKIYYGVENQTLAITNELTFSLSSLINAKIRLTDLRKTENSCQFNKIIEFQDQLINFERLVVHYELNLNFPTLDYIEIFPKTSEQVESNPIIHNYQARGYFPFHEFKVGLAVFNHTNIRPGDRRTFHQNPTIHEPIPAFMIRYGPVFLNHNGLGTLLLPFKYFTLLSAIILDGEPYRGSGLDERERSYYFGPIIKSHFFEFQYFREVAGIHSGEIIKFTLAPEIELTDNITLSPRLYYQIWDKRYVNYYFGISEHELDSSLAPFNYNGTKEHNWGYFLRGTMKQKNFDYFFEAGMKVFGGSVRNSPLTRTDRDYQLTLGFLYSIF